MKKLLLTLAALAMTSPAWADLICAACEYDTSAAGSYLGSLDPATHDRATFQHLTFERGRFRDFWVFDVGPGSAAASTLVASLGSITVFAASLFHDDGSVCESFACSDIDVGDSIESGFSVDGAIGLFNRLLPGRYVLFITGVVAPPRDEVYSGSIQLDPFTAREAGTLGLFGLGLAALGLAVRRHQR